MELEGVRLQADATNTCFHSPTPPQVTSGAACSFPEDVCVQPVKGTGFADSEKGFEASSASCETGISLGAPGGITEHSTSPGEEPAACINRAPTSGAVLAYHGTQPSRPHHDSQSRSVRSRLVDPIWIILISPGNKTGRRGEGKPKP